MMVGVLGIFFELSNPGAILSGVLGGISLILAFFAFQSLPINWAGLLLILFGIVLLIAEIKVVSHGVLTIGGVIAMLLGSMMLYDAPEAGSALRISWWVIVRRWAAPPGVVFALSFGMRALYRTPTTGIPGMVGETAVARTPLAPDGQVAVGGRAVAGGGAGWSGGHRRSGDDRGGGRAHPHRGEGPQPALKRAEERSNGRIRDEHRTHPGADRGGVRHRLLGEDPPRV